MKQLLLVILGPTSSGKSSLGVTLAQKFNGEIISADSVQVYRGLDIGSGKITEEEMHGIRHHLLDVADPNDYFSVVDFKEHVKKAIHSIIERDKLPILVGGTGQYIQAIVDNFVPPQVPPNQKLRDELATKSAKELFEELHKLDPDRALTVEKDNPRRLIRAIEIATALGKVPKIDTQFPSNYTKSTYNVLQIGLEWPKEKLREYIKSRVAHRIDNGFIEEVQSLYTKGISYERIKAFGLGYRCTVNYLEGEISQEELSQCIETSEWRYAKRQLRWFKRDSRIQWFIPNHQEKIEIALGSFIQSTD